MRTSVWRARIIYWIDRVLDRKCWQVVSYPWTPENPSHFGHRGVMLYVYRDSPVVIQYTHQPFMRNPHVREIGRP